MKSIWALLTDLAALVSNIVLPVWRSLRQNSGLAALSVVLAFGVWIVVTDAENPETTRVLNNVDIPVEAINVESDVAVESVEPMTVRVRVRVEEDVIESLTPADFAATVDLQGITVGEYERPVVVTPARTPGGLRIEEVLPPEVNVSIVALQEKGVNVVIEPTGDVPPGFNLISVEPERDTVIVSGPASKVDAVTQVTASLSIDGRTETFDQSVRLEARDSRGLLVAGVSVDPALISVRVEIEQEKFSRPLPINPVTEGTLAEGYAITSVEVDPPIVTVSGSQTVIERLTQVDTEPIDIDGADSTITRTVNLELAGLEVEGGDSRVTVTLTIEPQHGEVTIPVQLTVRNVPSGLTVVGALPRIDVTLSGGQPDLLDLTPADITVFVDLSGASAGTSQHDVEVSAPDGVDSSAGDPTRVAITLAAP
jgi:YbbR domain-containing protein